MEKKAETSTWYDRGRDFANEANERFDRLQIVEGWNKTILLQASFSESLRKAKVCFDRHDQGMTTEQMPPDVAIVK